MTFCGDKSVFAINLGLASSFFPLSLHLGIVNEREINIDQADYVSLSLLSLNVSVSIKCLCVCVYKVISPILKRFFLVVIYYCFAREIRTVSYTPIAAPQEQ